MLSCEVLTWDTQDTDVQTEAWEPLPQSRLMAELGSPSTPLVLALYAHHLRAFQREGVHDTGMMGGESPHLAASSSRRSFTNCRGTCRESTLSAICSRIRRWLPSVVGKRYMRQMAPPNTEGVWKTEA